jgi:hypothetical protein
MASCGVSVNLSAVESSVTAHLSKITGLGGLAGLPYMTSALLAGMAISNGNYFAAINMVVNVDGMLDAAWSGMREGFGELVGSAGDAGVSILSDDYLESIGIVATGNLAAPLENIVSAVSPGEAGFIGPLEATFAEKLTATVNDWGGKVTKFADETGLSSLSGYVDINMLDLAKSSIGMGASFDECDFGVSGIGNYFSDPATGAVKLLSNYAPKLGDTSMPSPVMKLGMSATEYLAMKASAKVTILGQQVSLKSVYSSFVPDEATNLISITAGNVSAVSSHLDKLKSPAKGAYGDGVRRLASGETVVENQASAIARLKETMTGRMPVTEYSNLSISFSI